MFQWDAANREHIEKHGITPNEAEEVILNNPFDLEFQLRNGENRIAQIGETSKGRVLVIVTAMREELIRVVTAFSGKRQAPEVLLRPEGK
ncbi:MAG TPA: BrnT family toxin [Terracidiphilus sp.]|nr:BrnT family toxin [Terracidiphilus sp.]